MSGPGAACVARSAKSIIAEAAVGVEDVIAAVYSGVATRGRAAATDSCASPKPGTRLQRSWSQ